MQLRLTEELLCFKEELPSIESPEELYFYACYFYLMVSAKVSHFIIV